MLKVVKTVINHLLIYSLLVLYEIGVQSMYVTFCNSGTFKINL